MKEDIEEVVERLEKSINDVWFSTTYSQEDEERDLKILLSDYKRVLKENEELLREKIDNKKIIALAQNEFLGYEQGYQDGKANRRSATQAIIEGQQYYIIQEQIERYKNQIEKLQKENKELKSSNEKLERANKCYINSIHSIVPVLNQDYIEKQKIQDKIKELEEKRIKMEKDDIGVGFTLGEEWSDLKSKIKAYKDLLEEKGE